MATEHDNLITRLERRIFNGEPFTFSGLHGNHDAAYRPADRLIQKYRKKGFIAFEREGREAVWSLTEAGFAEQKRREDTPHD
ncbi:hypothetical protein [Ancylobacter sp. IITR112]|uniref:hypothetical protein n=1 Tax=Ancylobacter sp. IITR112 TaxID=3138073 RepID=UPI00352B48E2